MSHWIRWILRIFAGLALLMFFLSLVLQLPPVQTYLIRQLVESIAARTGAEISVGKLAVRLPGSLVVKSIYLGDEQGDTLLAAKEIKAKIRLRSLPDRHVHLKKLEISGLTIHITRLDPATTFSYQFLLDAIEGKDVTNTMKVTPGAENDFLDTLPPGTSPAVAGGSPAGHPSDEQGGWTFSFRTFQLKNLDFRFADHMEGIDLQVFISEFLTSSNRLDLSAGLFKFGRTLISEPVIQLGLSEAKVEKKEKATVPFEFPDIDFSMQQFRVDGLSLDLYLPGEEVPSVFDLDLLVQNLYMQTGSAGFELRTARANIQDAIELKHLSGGITAGKEIRIQDMRMETSQSSLTAQLRIKAGIAEIMSMLDFSADSQVDPFIDLSIGELIIGQDLGLFFLHDTILSEQMLTHLPAVFSASLSGYASKLDIEKLDISLPGLGTLNMQGQIAGLPDIQNLRYDFPGIEMSAMPKAFRDLPFLNGITNRIQLPENLSLTASFKGLANNFSIRSSLLTEVGKLKISGDYRASLGQIPEYNARVEVSDLMPGSILYNEVFDGKLSATLSLQGAGIDAASLSGNSLLHISEMHLNQYQYKDLKLQAELHEGIARAVAGYHDENLSFEITGEVPVKENYSRIHTLIDIDKADLQALHFSDVPFVLKSSIWADLSLAGNDYIEGTLKIRQTNMHYSGQSFALDSLVVETALQEPEHAGQKSNGQDKQYMLKLRSGILAADYLGNITPLRVVDAIERHLGSYILAPSALQEGDSSNEHFRFSFTVFPSDWYTEAILPGLESFETFSFNGLYEGSSSTFRLEGRMPGLHYEGMGVSGLSLEVVSDRHQAAFQLGLDTLGMEGMLLEGIGINGIAGRQMLQLAFHTTKTTDDPWMTVTGNLDSLGMAFINSDLSVLFSQDAINPYRGIINGNVFIYEPLEKLSFAADLAVDGFGMADEVFGDIKMHVGSEDISHFLFDASVRNFGNRLDASGSLRLGEDPYVDAKLQIDQLDLSALEGFVSDQLQDIEGLASGSLHLSGHLNNPQYSGMLHLKDAKFLATFVNVVYRMPDETIVFDHERVSFRHFSLYDLQGRQASLGGHIITSDFNQPEFDLRFTSDQFLVLRLEPGQNEMVSGRALVSSDIRMRGSLQSPLIEGNLKLNRGSSFVMQVAQSQPEAMGDEGIVLFLSQDSLVDQNQALYPVPDAMTAPFSKLDLSLNVEIDPETDVRINIDEYAGDYLEVKGGGMVSFGVDPGGRISLSGRYELESGTYLLTFYDVLPRRFGIERGSNMMWTGDPMNPNVDIRAVYQVRASARELMDQAGTGEQADASIRQTFPFLVFLEMKGQLMQPQISFDIRLPANQQQALEGRLQSRLNELRQNESELNKQVFALLAIGSFIPEHPFSGAMTGQGITSAARTSASRLLTQQLNNLSNQYIRGVDIHFDIDSYEDVSGSGQGGRTQLNLEMSKNFFDERLRITLGGNIELEDETQRQATAGDIAGDFTIEYMLNEKGNLVLTGFRKKEFDDLFEGQVIETGVALIFKRTYNRFRELFARKRDEE